MLAEDHRLTASVALALHERTLVATSCFAADAQGVGVRPRGRGQGPSPVLAERRTRGAWCTTTDSARQRLPSRRSPRSSPRTGRGPAARRTGRRGRRTTAPPSACCMPRVCDAGSHRLVPRAATASCRSGGCHARNGTCPHQHDPWGEGPPGRPDAGRCGPCRRTGSSRSRSSGTKSSGCLGWPGASRSLSGTKRRHRISRSWAARSTTDYQERHFLLVATATFEARVTALSVVQNGRACASDGFARFAPIGGIIRQRGASRTIGVSGESWCEGGLT